MITYWKILRSKLYREQKVCVIVPCGGGKYYVMGLFGKAFLDSQDCFSPKETWDYLQYMIRKHKNTRDDDEYRDHPMGFIRRF